MTRVRQLRDETHLKARLRRADSYETLTFGAPLVFASCRPANALWLADADRAAVLARAGWQLLRSWMAIGIR
jgi:hypothetical protein